MPNARIEAVNDPIGPAERPGPKASRSGFRLFDSTACRFPKPEIPLLPTLGKESFRASRDKKFVPVDSAARHRFYSRGRYALYDAFRLAGVGPEGALLAPAYHCRSMIDPAVRLGGRILFYHLDSQLMPDWDSLLRLADRCTYPVRALLLTHYFGFPSCAESAKAFCDARGIMLIEDCSHAFFRSSCGGRPLGSCGTFAVASPYKFVPAEDGGELIANSDMSFALPGLKGPGILAELRGLVRAFQKAVESRRHRLSIDKLHAEIGRIQAADFARGGEFDQPGDTLSAMYEDSAEGVKGLSFSHWTTRASSADRIAEVRRANYCRWLDAVSGLPHCHPLFRELPDDVVPYMFPLYVDHPDPHFFVLKQLGMPIWRWDEIGISDCSLAMDYRLHLLHLPCHQGLRQLEMQWMTTALAKVMTEVPV